jgi:VCBS repeat-containing protein
MAVIAREPVASVPSNGNSNQGENEPSQGTKSHEPVSAGSAQSGPERKAFLHVVAQNAADNIIDVLGARFGDARAANDDASDPGPTVIFLDGSTVSGAVLTSSQRNAGHYLSEIAFEGTSFAVPQARATQVPGNFGTLTISASGAFSYTRADTSGGFSDAFTCTSRGCDRGRACVTIEVVARHEEMIRFQQSAAG